MKRRNVFKLLGALLILKRHSYYSNIKIVGKK